MIRDPRKRREFRVLSLASLAALLLVSVALLGFGLRQLVHLGRPATYRLNALMDTEPNRQVLARRIAAEARKRGLVIELMGEPKRVFSSFIHGISALPVRIRSP